jgi:hypothetical protein
MVLQIYSIFLNNLTHQSASFFQNCLDLAVD